jgi:DNA-binding CsgD family transcriptional regulator
MKTKTGNPLARSPIHLLHRAHQAVGQIFTNGMKTGDLTPRQLAVLVAVAENEGSASSIARKLG